MILQSNAWVSQVVLPSGFPNTSPHPYVLHAPPISCSTLETWNRVTHRRARCLEVKLHASYFRGKRTTSLSRFGLQPLSSQQTVLARKSSIRISRTPFFVFAWWLLLVGFEFRLFVSWSAAFLCHVCGSHSPDCAEWRLLDCDAMEPCRRLLTLRKKCLHVLSSSNMEALFPSSECGRICIIPQFVESYQIQLLLSL
jgi:hypothetical protein